MRCAILLAVSGIRQTHPGRCWSGLVSQSAGELECQRRPRLIYHSSSMAGPARAGLSGSPTMQRPGPHCFGQGLRSLLTSRRHSGGLLARRLIHHAPAWAALCGAGAGVSAHVTTPLGWITGPAPHLLRSHSWQVVGPVLAAICRGMLAGLHNTEIPATLKIKHRISSIAENQIPSFQH